MLSFVFLTVAVVLSALYYLLLFHVSFLQHAIFITVQSLSFLADFQALGRAAVSLVPHGLHVGDSAF